MNMKVLHLPISFVQLMAFDSFIRMVKIRHKSTMTYVIPSSDEQTSYFVSLRSFRSNANVNIKPSIANTISIISDQ